MYIDYDEGKEEGRHGTLCNTRVPLVTTPYLDIAVMVLLCLNRRAQHKGPPASRPS